MSMIDSHAHLSSPELREAAEELIARAEAAGVAKIINIATDQASLEHALALQLRFPSVKTAAATTPHDIHLEGEALFPLMEEAALSGKLIAVGETGLDYYYWKETKEMQKQFLRRYLHLAEKADLPFIIHCRDAFDDLYAILDEETKSPRGVMHCFTGTTSEAEEALKRGLYISFSGIITYKKSEALREIARNVPLDRLLIETDSPYLAPESKRGRKNEPAYLLETAKQLAALRTLPLEELIQVLKQNAKRLFNF